MTQETNKIEERTKVEKSSVYSSKKFCFVQQIKIDLLKRHLHFEKF